MRYIFFTAMVFAALWYYGKKQNKTTITRYQSSTKANLDSIQNVLEVISTKVFITVQLKHSFNYQKTIGIPIGTNPINGDIVKFPLGSKEFINNIRANYTFCFNMGFDLSGNRAKYIKNGRLNIPYLQNRITLINYQVTRKIKKDEGDFKLTHLDSLERNATRTALDSLKNWYKFNVKLKGNTTKIEVKHRH